MTTGIYYLWDGERVIYVGSSVNVEKRIRAHCQNIDFAGYFCDPCAPSELLTREAEAIKQFRPLLNVCAVLRQ
jgi:predicted GIY-YIG superfamily endonuclease